MNTLGRALSNALPCRVWRESSQPFQRSRKCELLTDGRRTILKAHLTDKSDELKTNFPAWLFPVVNITSVLSYTTRWCHCFTLACVHQWSSFKQHSCCCVHFCYLQRYVYISRNLSLSLSFLHTSARKKPDELVGDVVIKITLVYIITVRDT